MKMMFAAGPNTLAAAFLNCYIPYEKRLARSASLRFIFTGMIISRSEERP